MKSKRMLRGVAVIGCLAAAMTSGAYAQETNTNEQLNARTGHQPAERSATRPLTSEANGELPMHFRIYDLAADRCVWSIPPIDTVPVKLRGQKLVVRAIDNDDGVFEVASVDGVRLADLATQFLADRRVNRLNIHLAADDSYAGRVVRHDNQ